MKLIYVTTKNYEQAREISRKLVEEKLAACVNYFHIDSFYRWEGEVKSGQEIVLFVKTKLELVDEVTARIKELHTDEIPSILSIDVEADHEYLQWVEKETK